MGLICGYPGVVVVAELQDMVDTAQIMEMQEKIEMMEFCWIEFEIRDEERLLIVAGDEGGDSGDARKKNQLKLMLWLEDKVKASWFCSLDGSVMAVTVLMCRCSWRCLVLDATETVNHSDSLLTKLSSSWTSKPPLEIKYRLDTGALVEQGPKSHFSTLEQLLAWEKKLYQEFKAREKY
ncbi:hypothetical protein MKW98_013451 [Papaver atlanticum]|uniref:DUF632 domain-containing protein n=1 Tax=Papaver atlanticum TaxID=357466 RepID=A0AAD4SU04_9MAGN|nr:hypothetical protein MKW98_013451 [Papaver atlanticum]